MACTTVLVGKKASYDGSTMIARNDDSGSGHFTPKKFTVVKPEEQKRTYESVISHVKIGLPDNPMRYTAMPNALEGEGIWAASGVNYAIKTGRSWHLKKGLLQPISVTQDSWILPRRLLRTAEWWAVLSAVRC